MFFSQEKERNYERLMLEPPNCNKGTKHKERGNNSYKYKYADMDCQYCLYYENCDFNLCPEIMENLDDLIEDNDFFRAVETAEYCMSAHKKTLIALRKYFWEEDEYA